MSKKDITGNEPSDFRSNSIPPNPRKVLGWEITYDREKNVIRMLPDLEEADSRPPVEDTPSCGTNTPLPVKDCGEKSISVLDWHRRLAALQTSVTDDVEEDSDIR